MTTRILVVSTSSATAELIRQTVRSAVIDIDFAEGREVAAWSLLRSDYDLMVVDAVRVPEALSVIPAVRRLQPRPEVIVLSGDAGAGSASLIQTGATEVLCSRDAADVGRHIGMIVEGMYGAGLPPRAASAPELLGSAEPTEVLRSQLRGLSAHRALPVLLVGEAGAGKRLAARVLHHLSAAEHPFVELDCERAVGSEEALAAMLFGTAAADAGSAGGVLQRAGRGTLYLSNALAAPDSIRARLLEVLEAGSFLTGDQRRVRFRGRLVTSIRPPLDVARLAPLLDGDRSFAVRVPALRERASDIAPLSRAFLAARRGELGLVARPLSEAGARALSTAHWPENISQLRRVVDVLAEDDAATEIGARDVDRAYWAVSAATPRRSEDGGLRLGEPSLPEMERSAIVHAFYAAGKNVTLAAERLGIPRSTLRDRLRRYGAR